GSWQMTLNRGDRNVCGISVMKNVWKKHWKFIEIWEETKTMSFQKVLYCFPENPLENNAGNKTRALQLLQYFKDRQIAVDFVSLLQGMSQWNEQDVEKIKQSGLINNLYFIQKKPSKKNRIKYFLTFKIPNYFFKRKMSSSSMLNKHISWNHKIMFEEILDGGSYSHIIISYLYWSELVNSVSASKSITIMD